MREVVEGAELGFVDELKNPVPAGLGDVMRHERRISCRLKREASRAAREDNWRVEKRMRRLDLIRTADVRRQGSVAFGSRN